MTVLNNIKNHIRMNHSLETILAYHKRTKHQLQRYAAGPERLDWVSQPEPFRFFEGCTRLELPLLEHPTGVLYSDLYLPEKITPRALSLKNIAQLLELSLGLSAWKQHETTRWALRCNPSSGNLHPTEAYLVIEHCEGITDGVHHYVSRDHILEQRCRFSHKKMLLPESSLLLGLSSIHWREAWKYGERAYRYCQLDAGHAIASVRYAAATLGWQACVLTHAGDKQIAAISGIDRNADFDGAESEYPDVMLLITTKAQSSENITFSLATLRDIVKHAQWYGQANTLSQQHLNDWPVIAEAALACTKPQTDEPLWQAPSRPVHATIHGQQAASTLIKQRRSAQEFDTHGSINDQFLYRMLDLTLPRQSIPPWDAISREPRIHLLLFIHRVNNLQPGLYLFLRNDHIKNIFQNRLKQEFEWIKPQGCPQHLQLFRLLAGDARNIAMTLSCHQDIASDGALSLGMLAEYEMTLNRNPWVYRELFLEAGMLGQILYLEAESAGFRGTGIGCYFDDEVHALAGINGQEFQSLYHFTLGTPLTDNRLQTLPAYAHLQRVNREER